MQKIRIIFLEKSELNQYTIRAINNFNSKFSSDIDYLNADELLTNNSRYKYKFLNCITGAYECSLEDDLLIVFLGVNSGILNIELFLKYLEVNHIKDYVFGFRVLNIKGIALKGSPRLPFVDDSIFVMSKKMFKKKGLAEKKLVNACHFYKYTNNNSLLQSLIEYSLHESDFVNLYNEDGIKDEYGNTCKHSFPNTFSLCVDSSIVYADLKYNSEYRNLLALNFDHLSSDIPFVYLNESTSKKLVFQLIKRVSGLFRLLINKEFKKTYNE